MYGHKQTRITLQLLSLVFLFGNLFSASLFAHEAGWSYIFLDVTEDSLSGRIELPLDQLQLVLPLDKNGDGSLTESEVDTAWPSIQVYAHQIMTLGSGGSSYPITFTGRDSLNIEIADYAVLNFEADTPAPLPYLLEARFTPFFETTPMHRGGLVVENNEISGVMKNHREIVIIFAPGRTSGVHDLRGEPLWSKLWRFAEEGVWHIWIGIDHVLFLITLLLTAVMAKSGSQWQPVPDFRTALINLVTIVTLFTIAHSLTLALALKGWVELPSRLVESIIALSVIVVASNGIRPWLSDRIWVLVFAFGLFHGLGFATVLEDLMLYRDSKLTSLIGFNIGVEIGQLAIVAVVFPVLYLIRETAWYRRYLLPAVSTVVGGVGLWWLLSRALNIESPITSF